MTTRQILENAKNSKSELATLSTSQKNIALESMANSLISNTSEILKANAKDMATAKGSISDTMLDRLLLDEKRILAMADGIRQVAALPDPVGRILDEKICQNGLVIQRTAVPIGVIAIIYESRPNVTSDAAALALKSGNVSVLRSGKEAFSSASAIVDALKKGLANVCLSPNLINLISDTSRNSATELMTAVGFVDLLIPRGGAGLIKACIEQARVPCIHTGTGICHIYVDKYAKIDMAIKIVNNAKTSRPSVCNAAEVCLVHSSIAEEFLPLLKNTLVDTRKMDGLIPVDLRLCSRSIELIDGTLAEPDDFDTEFLDYRMAVKIIDSCEDAIQHINSHSTGHSEAIITSDEATAKIFTTAIDSAAVYVNASTRFTDGGEFGLGCEMGISTQKLYVRGPMGLEELTTHKYIIRGNGQIR